MDLRFTPALIKMAQSSHKKFWPSGPFVSITLAQWAVESDYGAHMSGVNNPFGIQATFNQIQNGKARQVWSREWIGGKLVPKFEWFANFGTMEDAFDAHATLLTTQHYARCMDAPTPWAYAQALFACDYATAPNYPQVLTTVIDDNNLTQFDERF